MALEVVYIWLHRGISNQIYSATTVLGYVTAFHKAFDLLDQSHQITEKSRIANKKAWTRVFVSSSCDGSMVVDWPTLRSLLYIARRMDKSFEIPFGSSLVFWGAIIYFFRIEEAIDFTHQNWFSGHFFDYHGQSKLGMLARFETGKTIKPGSPPMDVVMFQNSDWCLDPFALKKETDKLAKEENPFVFSAKTGLQWTGNQLNKALAAVIAEWKLAQTPQVKKTHPLFVKGAKFRFHSIRASMITALFTWGYQLPHVMCLVRHKSPNSSMHYKRKSRAMGTDAHTEEGRIRAGKRRRGPVDRGPSPLPREELHLLPDI